jgi:LuxR family maltose regulon positive regulatory protein
MLPVLLATKLHLPATRARAVARARLIERLSQDLAEGSRLTLVSAPAGFGKTTVLGEWAGYLAKSGAAQCVAWVSIDERDNDPVRFLTYVIAALQSVAPGVGAEALRLLHAPQTVPIEHCLTALINALTQAPVAIVLVLDDLHLITAEPVHVALAFLIEYQPERLHLALATRSDPPLPLARLRARGALTELRAADLRFTPDEAAAFLNQAWGLDLAAGDIATLEARTEGWIAGLQMAALSLQGRTDRASFIQAFAGSHRYVLDYLIEEVLERQTSAVRDFLLHTAILEQVTAPLGDALTGRADGAVILGQLERANLFVIALDDRRAWYRYHALFADALQARLATTQPARVPELHRRASDWFAAQGLPADAVRHALAAGDVERAAHLIEQAWPALRQGREDVTLRGWLRQLPDTLIRQRPALSVYAAWAGIVAGDLAQVESYLQAAEHGLSLTEDSEELGERVANDDERLRLPAIIAAYRAALAQATGDVAGTARQARHALALVDADDHLGRAAAAGLLGLAEWANGELDAAQRTFAQAVASLHRAGNTADAISGSLVQAGMLLAQGRLRAARRLYEQTLHPALAQGETVPPVVADVYVGLSELDAEQNQLELAARHLEQAQTFGEHASLPENRHRRFLALARIRQAEGDLAGALTALDQAERIYLRGFFPDVRPVSAMRARLWLSQGRLDDVERWARERGLGADDAPVYLREYEHLTLARAMIARVRAERDVRAEHDVRAERDLSTVRSVTALLARLLRAAEAGGRTASVSEILMLQALVEAGQGRLAAALPPLARALRQAEPEGYVRLFLDEGAPLVELLHEAARRRIEPRYVRALLATGSGPATPAPPAQPLAEALSTRELDVLRLLRSELSGPEIAAELSISLNTLRTHTKTIFAKLEVNNRRAAVRRADELGLAF